MALGYSDQKSKFNNRHSSISSPVISEDLEQWLPAELPIVEIRSGDTPVPVISKDLEQWLLAELPIVEIRSGDTPVPVISKGLEQSLLAELPMDDC